jgi:hypothetical protein
MEVDVWMFLEPAIALLMGVEIIEDDVQVAIREGGNHAVQASRPGTFTTGTGLPEAVARLRFPQNVACGFPALRSSAGDSQNCKSLQLRVREVQLWFQ